MSQSPHPMLNSMPYTSLLVTLLSVLLVPTLGHLQFKSGRDQAAAQAAAQQQEVYYVSSMGDRFEGFLTKHQEAMVNFDAAEKDRLRSAMMSATNLHDRVLLETTAKAQEESRLAAQNAFSEMRNFVTTLKQAMGALGGASRCQDLTCGAHAHCAVDEVHGAQCQCKDGYQGNGFVCKTPLQFNPQSLMQFQSGKSHPKMADIHVSTLQGDTIVAVYRDASSDHKGYAMLGHASADSMRWRTPVLFSDKSQAFSPVVVQLKSSGLRGGIAIAYRDADRGGDGILLGGHIHQVTGEVTLGKPKAFARHQAQAMAMLPLSDSRVALVFAEHILTEGSGGAGQVSGGAMYGATLLAQIPSNGKAPEVIAKDRFAAGPVARLSVTALSPTMLAIAYRQGQVQPGGRQAEAACIAGQVWQNHIIFNSPAVLLEPDQSNIWSRSISRIGDNLLAYTYHSGDEKVTKQAILRADPKTHRLGVVHGPEVVAHGFAPTVGSLALVPTLQEMQQQASGPFPLNLSEKRRQYAVRLLTYIGQDGSQPSQAKICGVSSGGVPSACQDLTWGNRDIASGSSAALSDGRFIFMFADTKGNPFYQFVGLGDPLI